jgi:type IV pilus assembly protein PilC
MPALDRADVEAHLHAQRIRPIRIQRKRQSQAPRPARAKEVARFTRQLAALVQAGIPLLSALKLLDNATEHPSMRAVAQDLMTQVQSGASLHQAMQTHDCFGPVYLGMVAAAEASGQLDVILAELAQSLDSELGLREALKSALTYPLAVLVLSAVVLAIMLAWVVPAFESIFTSMGAELPAPTQLVLTLSRWWVAHGWTLTAALVALGMALRHWLRHDAKGQWALAQMALALPIWGQLVQLACVSRWARTLSSLMQAGVSLPEALDISAKASGNLCYEKSLALVRLDVMTGTAWAHALEHGSSVNAASWREGLYSPLFSPQVVQMVAVGEASGRLDDMLMQVARMHEAQVQWLQKRIGVLMEPTVIVVLGVLIGGLVTALYLPIFQLGQVL